MSSEDAVEVMDGSEEEEEGDEDGDNDVTIQKALAPADTTELRDVHERLTTWEVVAAKGKTSLFWQQFGVYDKNRMPKVAVCLTCSKAEAKGERAKAEVHVGEGKRSSPSNLKHHFQTHHKSEVRASSSLSLPFLYSSPPSSLSLVARHA
jgi:hypothetical protein